MRTPSFKRVLSLLLTAVLVLTMFPVAFVAAAEQSILVGTDRYDVFIAGNGGVGANPDSSWIFYMFSGLAKINNPQNFKTDKATTFFIDWSKNLFS